MRFSTAADAVNAVPPDTAGDDSVIKLEETSGLEMKINWSDIRIGNEE